MPGKDIVLFSTADWDHPYWTNKQHVALELSKAGYRVLYVNSIGLRKVAANKRDFARIGRRLRRLFSPRQEVGKDLWAWSPPVLPFHSIKWVRTLNGWLLRRGLREQMKALALREPALWTYHPLTCEYLDVAIFSRVLYHCVDDIGSQPGMPTSLIARAERQLVRTANCVFTTAPVLQEKWQGENARTYHHPNVVDYEHFSRAHAPGLYVPSDLAGVPRPRLGFVGALSAYKVDFELLQRIAMDRPDWSIVLIGEIGVGEYETDVNSLRRLPNVCFLGPKAYAELPAYLGGMDVALIPARRNDYTQAMFPMKFFEYLAAGVPVVATALPALAQFREFHVAAGSAADFVKGVEACLDRDDARIARGIELARGHTYARRTAQMIEALYRDSEAEAVPEMKQ